MSCCHLVGPRKLRFSATIHTLPHLRLGEAIRVALVDLEAFVAEKRQQF